MDKKYINSYKELEVFKLSYGASLDIHKLSLNFPKIEQFKIANQLRRSSKSICANIAEGFAKQNKSKPEFQRFLTIALGSCSEVSLWVQYCFDLKYINNDDFLYYSDLYNKIYAMLLKLRG